MFVYFSSNVSFVSPLLPPNRIKPSRHPFSLPIASNPQLPLSLSPCRPRHQEAAIRAAGKPLYSNTQQPRKITAPAAHHKKPIPWYTYLLYATSSYNLSHTICCPNGLGPNSFASLIRLFAPSFFSTPVTRSTKSAWNRTSSSSALAHALHLHPPVLEGNPPPHHRSPPKET